MIAFRPPLPHPFVALTICAHYALKIHALSRKCGKRDCSPPSPPPRAYYADHCVRENIVINAIERGKRENKSSFDAEKKDLSESLTIFCVPRKSGFEIAATEGDCKIKD